MCNETVHPENGGFHMALLSGAEVIKEPSDFVIGKETTRVYPFRLELVHDT